MTSSLVGLYSCFAAVVNLNLTTNSPHFLKEKHYIHSVGSERVNSLTNLYHMIHFVSLRFTVHELFCSIHLLLGEAVLCFFCNFSLLNYFYNFSVSSPPPEWDCALAGGCMWTRLKPCHKHHITVKSRDITFPLRWTENLCMNCNFQKLNLMQSSRWWLQCADTLPPAWPSNTGKGKLFVKKRQRKPGQKRREKQGHLQTRRHSPFDPVSRSPHCERPPSRSSTP